jgi:hypothetical protein
LSFGAGSGYSFGRGPSGPLVTDDKTILSLAEDTNGVKADTVEAARVLVQLDETIRLYGEHAQAIEDAEIFENSLREIEENLTRAVKHTVVTLASEIDHGRSEITSFRDSLEISRQDFATARQGARKSPSQFLIRFQSEIQKRSAILSEAINNFEDNLTQNQEQQSSQALVDVLQHQHEAIVRCAARVARLKERSLDVQRRLKEMRARDPAFAQEPADDLEDGEVRTLVESVIKQYQDFRDDRKRNLEKRNTDPTKFKKPVVPARGFGPGFGTGQKSTFGAGFGTAAATGGAAATAATAPALFGAKKT